MRRRRRIGVQPWQGMVRPFVWLQSTCLSQKQRVFTFPKIKHDQDVGNVLCLPFVSTWLNAVAFVFYAFNKKDWLVVGINGFAFVVESYYCVKYIWYATGGKRKLAWVMGVLQVIFFFIMLVLQLTVFKDGKHSDVRDNVYGIIGAVTAFLMYASTINQAFCAFSTHNVAGLELAWGFLVNAAIWTLYSCLPPEDHYLLIANAMGVAFTGFQCGVWFKFRRTTSPRSRRTTSPRTPQNNQRQSPPP